MIYFVLILLEIKKNSLKTWYEKQRSFCMYYDKKHILLQAFLIWREPNASSLNSRFIKIEAKYIFKKILNV